MSKLIYDPLGIFEQRSDKGGVCIVKDVVFSAAGATNNQQVIAAIAAVAGSSPAKQIVVLHGTMRSAGALGAITFKSASGGTNLCAYEIPANTVATPNVQIGPIQWGVFRTVAGQGLFVDNTSADVVTISLSYIEVVP